MDEDYMQAVTITILTPSFKHRDTQLTPRHREKESANQRPHPLCALVKPLDEYTMNLAIHGLDT